MGGAASNEHEFGQCGNGPETYEMEAGEGFASILVSQPDWQVNVDYKF